MGSATARETAVDGHGVAVDEGLVVQDRGRRSSHGGGARAQAADRRDGPHRRGPGRRGLRVRAALHRGAQLLEGHHLRVSPWRTSGTGLGQTAPLLQAILERSQHAGLVRPDIEVADIVVVLMAVRSIADLCDTKSPNLHCVFSNLLWTDFVQASRATPSHP